MANQSAIGGNVRYPSLQSIGDLFRASINDTMNNTTGTGVGTGNQAGLIMSNQNPDLVTFMDEAIPEIFSDLRNVGDPELILDNYILEGIPALQVQDPTVQVGLNYAGFFNGYTWSNLWTLPIGLTKMLAMWERQSGTNNSFSPMRPAPFGIGGGLQGLYMGLWELRGDTIWMPGATQALDLRIRCRIGYPIPLFSTNLDFQTTYVPILDCKNAIVAKMRIQYALRFAPELYQTAIAEETRLMSKLKLEIVRAMQGQENQREPFGEEATADFAIAWAWL
jgi:hypothetical protein